MVRSQLVYNSNMTVFRNVLWCQRVSSATPEAPPKVVERCRTWLQAPLHALALCDITLRYYMPHYMKFTRNAFQKVLETFLSWVLAVLHEVLHTLFVVFHTVIGGITRSSTNELYQHTLFHKLKFNWKISYFFTSEFGKLLRFVYSIFEVLRSTLG